MMREEDQHIPPFMRQLMPTASDEELARASENMRAYLVTKYLACLRILKEEMADSQESKADDRVQRTAPAKLMNSYYAYIRVSTVKQGEKGSSLQEQRASIEAFAARQNFEITKWFQEQETAAKRGRGEFVRMMTALERGKATGVILHKIDRGARNLWDWARIQDLVERGVEVHFAHDSVDLTSRGGRLSADIQAVVAADYIRNLRDEVHKGIVGRLKQGYCPWSAPVGYLDRGKAKPKEIDPIAGPLVALAFELYASGNYTVATLRKALFDRGLRSHQGNTISAAQVSRMLRNPFYIGLNLHRSTGVIYQGVHAPLISKALFERVSDVFEGRGAAHVVEHAFPYRRMVRCAHCGRFLTGELQKGHAYYRCHERTCPTKGIREEVIVRAIDEATRPLVLSRRILRECEVLFVDTKQRYLEATIARKQSAQLQLEALEQRLSRLMSGFLENVVDKEFFQETHAALLRERVGLRDLISREDTEYRALEQTLFKCERMLRIMPLSDKRLLQDELRTLLKTLSSNLYATGKNVVVELREPFRQLSTGLKLLRGGRSRVQVRTPQRRVPHPTQLQEVLSGELLLELEEALRYWEPPASLFPQVEKMRPEHWFKPKEPPNTNLHV